MGHFPVGQLARDHAGHFTAGGKYGVGHGSHQADVAAAVHQAQAVAGDAVTQGNGALGIGRLAASVGATVDADGLHGGSCLLVRKRKRPAGDRVSGRGRGVHGV
ncbi:hypothetical protein G6F31_019162 [Rhizopus arrhizus]|nr:hypothetical protein G6F31_019162 [Rhizopus arrhizus]